MKKLLIGIVVAVAVIGGAYFLLNRQGSSGQATGNEPTEFVTHTSKEFSFRYPKNWFVEDSSGNFIPYVALRNYESGVSGAIGIPENYFKIEIVKFPKEPTISLESWINEYMKNSESQPVGLFRDSTKIGGNPAISQLEKVQGITHPVVYVDRDDFVYTIGTTPLFEQFEDIYQSFLESFVFIERK